MDAVLKVSVELIFTMFISVRILGFLTDGEQQPDTTTFPTQVYCGCKGDRRSSDNDHL